MSLLTIVEASKQFNVTRPRIYRAIKKGELTTALNEDGIQVVQVQDMIRLFDNIKKKPVPKNVRNAVSNTDIKLVRILEEQLRKAEEDKAFLKQQIQDLRSDFDDYKLRIEHQIQAKQKTDLASNEHTQKNESLQVEHAEKVTSEPTNFEKPADQDKPIKKSLFSRLVKEILK